ncbi:MAG: hypothetical protein HY927_06575 [Elusimicrobia bacterium]|nr:hypothetical protein [Elusimicrobiota bacterium]
MRSPLVLAAAALLALSGAEAAWYDFARNESAPEIAELSVAGRQMEDLVELLALFPDELKGGKIVLRGRAATTRGSMGAVLVSVDGGANFEKAKLERSGAFFFDFSPTPEREHELQIRAVDTTGRSSDPKAGSFKLVVRPDRSRGETLAVFNKLLELYKAKDRAGFMARVSENFEGSRSALEEGLESDFANLSNIELQPSIDRVGNVGGVIEVDFTFNRKVQSRTSSKTLTDKSKTTMSFIREGEEYKLYSMAAPLIFGVAATAEVATSVDAVSQGDKVLAVTAQGDAVQVTQQQSAGATADQTVSNIVSGTLNVVCAMNTGDTTPLCPAVSLESRASTRNLTFQQQRHARDMDTGEVSITVSIPDPLVASNGCVWVVEPGSRIRDIGQSSLEAVKTVSSDSADYAQAIPADNAVAVTVGKVFAVKTPTLYALLKATTAACTYTPPPPGPPKEVSINAVFEYRIQLSQNPSFY